ncbi:MAG: PduL/EutD family phosphate acyltransferase, partial [Deltaproteobacteria bacterium]|nr:PduL/EutD family phosphate acyltransferase [Deltaproteobacteria bacterium]
MTPESANKYGVEDNGSVDVEILSDKPTRFFGVQVRVNPKFNTEMHLQDLHTHNGKDMVPFSGLRNNRPCKNR